MSKKKYKPYTKKCVVCNNEFNAWSSLDKFCSPSCFITDVKNATVSRKENPQSYARQRAKNYAKKRDKGMCQLRPYLPAALQHDQHKVMPQVHHIVFLSQGGPDRQWNLITLCEQCHKQIAHKFKHDWQAKLLEIVNGEFWLEAIELSDGPWSDESDMTKQPRYVEVLRGIWRTKPESQDVAITG